MNRAYRAGLVTVVLAGVLGVGPAAAFTGRTEPGRTYISGDGSLYYHKGTTMLGPLGVFIAIFVVLVSDDDETDSSEWGTRECRSDCHDVYGEIGFPLEAVQLGSSAGLFVVRNLALGMRMVAQDNGKKDPVGSFWGGGPEVSWYPGHATIPLRPFISLSALFARGHTAGESGRRRVSGPLYQVRTGLSWFGHSGGIFVQASRQMTSPDGRTGLAQTRSGWGAGMGITFYLD